jgi:hypothetical protein
MKKTLLFGSLLAVFLMIMVPTVSVTEAKVFQSAKTSYILNLQTAYAEVIKAKYANDPSPQTIILLTLLIWLLKLLRIGAVFLIGGIILLIGGILLIIRILRHHNTTGLTC